MSHTPRTSPEAQPGSDGPPGSPDPVAHLVRPDWPPVRHVRAGWQALTRAERTLVETRLAAVKIPRPSHDERGPMLHFFSFLAQVETIAIEIPLRFLPHCPADVQPTLRRQLVDEVFHSTLFARIAHELAHPAAQPPPPLASAERLLDRIRKEKDPGVTATMLNLVAEGWIETLFRHARRWGIADEVFQTVLEDEARHVHEATDYTASLDKHRAREAVSMLEEGLIEVGTEPTVALAMLRLAGPEAYRRLTRDLHHSHRRHLAEVGMEPGPQWAETVDLQEQLLASQSMDAPEPVPDTAWTTMARAIWQTPRDPTMQGSFDLRVGHIPKRLLTPVLVAAVGRAWARHPELNRVLAQSRIWRLPRVNVGVRVMVAPDELATVVITDADKRSVRDIGRMLEDGVRQLDAMRLRRKGRSDPQEALASGWDPDLAAWAPPGEGHFAVGISNVGKFGLVEGAGAFTGAITPSTDLTVGQRVRKPVWRGAMYLPAWHVPVGALQDHRVFDGATAGKAMQAVQSALSRRTVREILRAPDTIPDEDPPAYDDAWFEALPPALRMVPAVGLSKYLPIALGGLGIGAGLGIGGYFLYQSLAAGSAASGGAVGAAGGASGGGVPGAAPATLHPLTPDGAPRCQAVNAQGFQCAHGAEGGDFCRVHGG